MPAASVFAAARGVHGGRGGWSIWAAVLAFRLRTTPRLRQSETLPTFCTDSWHTSHTESRTPALVHRSRRRCAQLPPSSSMAFRESAVHCCTAQMYTYLADPYTSSQGPGIAVASLAAFHTASHQQNFYRQKCNISIDININMKQKQEPHPATTHRAHILPDKDRTRRLPVKTGATFCGPRGKQSHICPECGTGLTDSHALTRHLSKPLCPTLKRNLATQSKPWYTPFCNLPERIQLKPAPQTGMIDIPQLESLVDHLLQHKSLHYTDHVKPTSSTLLPEAASIQNQWSDPRDSSVKMEPKHFHQIAALASLALSTPPASDATATILELCAGRAYTSMYIADVLKRRNVTTHILAVDKAPARNKADRALRAWVQHPTSSISSFQRLRVDLRHFDMAHLPHFSDSTHLIVVGKHLCGAALDMSLIALNRYLTRNPSHRRPITLVLACCCRRLCCWQAMDPIVLQNCGLTQLQFSDICRAAQWGLDSTHAADRAQLGFKCRRLVDLLRVASLTRAGWRAYVSTYTHATPENACIVARYHSNTS